MYKTQTRFTLCLEAMSDIHIGSGIGKDKTQTPKIGDRAFQHDPTRKIYKDVGYVPTIRDHDNTPCIPATSLKGPLRALLEHELFGSAKDESAGQGGKLWFYAAQFIREPHDRPELLPFWDESEATYIAPHNKTDKQDETNLFHIEYIPKGTVFSCDCLFLGDIDTAKTEVLPLLNAFATGIKIGGRKNNERGMIRIQTPCVDFYETVLPGFDISKCPPNGIRQQKTIPLTPDASTTRICRHISFTLKAKGPYYSRDPNTKLFVHKMESKLFNSSLSNPIAPIRINTFDGVKKKRAEVTAALHRKQGEVLLTGESLKHALRRICAYEENCQKGHTEIKYDDPAASFDKPDTLTSTQRLFGITGWAGLLSIDEIKPNNRPETHLFHGLKLDVFSSGTIDSAKYQTQAAIAPAFAITINIKKRGDYPTKKDLVLLKRVLAKIGKEGLELAAESSAGFGWFDVENLQTQNLDKHTSTGGADG